MCRKIEYQVFEKYTHSKQVLYEFINKMQDADEKSKIAVTPRNEEAQNKQKYNINDPTSMIRKKEKGCFSRMIDENRKNRKEIRKRIKLYYQRGIKAQNIKSSAKIENHQMKI